MDLVTILFQWRIWIALVPSIGYNPLTKLSKRKSRRLLYFQHKQLCNDYKVAKTQEDSDTKYHIV
jgi:hypothetical protein